jgi:adhesin/invasin
MLGGVQVMINGHNAPLVYVTPTQIVAQVPQMVSPANQSPNARIQVNNNNVLSNGVTVYTNYTAPGVFSVGGGVGFAAAERQNLSVITASNPANIGETIVLYASGLGAVNPAVNDGAPAPSTVPLATTVDADLVYLGGQQGKVIFNGLTPGLAGLYQLNTTILQGTPTGTVLADISTPDAYTSQAVIAVTGAASSMAVGPRGLVARPPARKAGLPERAR